MSLTKGDHLVIKRGDHVLTPADGELYHEFEVMSTPELENVTSGEDVVAPYYLGVDLRVTDPEVAPETSAEETSAEADESFPT
ncbi:hypothetical protein LCGC14_1266480 [marine sediment metagenome]|uniref:Uncharacterized protein n=1 Tax=marine sediment metagenome TaxID=412755 RepID=A0A0F9NFY8_9ZZZZ